MPEIITRTPQEELKKILFLPDSIHKTQLNQEIFALIVNRFKSGYFLEIGANDGFTLSNTVYLEEKFMWNGLLVEANPQYESSLVQRKAKSVLAAIAEMEGDYEFLSAGLYGGVKESIDLKHEKQWSDADRIVVSGTRLEKVLNENNAPELIHFVSVDVEGAELEVVRQMCSLKQRRFLCGCIEHNHREADYIKIKNMLTNVGYQVVWERQTGHDLFFVDKLALSDNA